MECVVKCVVFLSLLISVQSAIYNWSAFEGGATVLFCCNGTKGNVTWEKDTDGGRELILSAEDGKIIKRHKADPEDRYKVLPGILIIMRVFLSDSGIYYCNGDPVENLTVVSLAPPADIFVSSAIEGGVTPLFCKNDGLMIWEKYTDGGREFILTFEDGNITKRHKPDPEDRYKVLPGVLIIMRTFLSDSGIYYCNGYPVVNLTVVSHVPTAGPSPTRSMDSSGRVSELEIGLMFGGVGLAALVFLLATVAAVRVIHQRASLEGGAARLKSTSQPPAL